MKAYFLQTKFMQIRFHTFKRASRPLVISVINDIIDYYD